jgi:hypothetical protein
MRGRVWCDESVVALKFEGKAGPSPRSDDSRFVLQASASARNSAADEEVGGHGGADGDDDPTDVLLVHFLRVIGAAVAADEAADEHEDGLRPDDNSGEYESEQGDGVDDADEKVFDSVHRVNIFHAEQGEKRKDQDADARAEIADVHGDEQFERETGDEERAGSLTLRGAIFYPGADARAGDEKQSGAEQQPGNQAEESRLRRAEENARAEEASEDADEKERGEQAARLGGEGLAIGDGAGDGAGPDRGSVSGVGGDGRDAGEEQSGEGDEAAATGDGIEQAGN